MHVSADFLVTNKNFCNFFHFDRDGARYNRYAFDRTDIGRVITVRADAEDSTFIIETASDVIRTESYDFGGAQYPGKVSYLLECLFQCLFSVN